MDEAKKDERIKSISDRLNLFMQKKGLAADNTLTEKAVEKKK